jgi:hypothetical protein
MPGLVVSVVHVQGATSRPAWLVVQSSITRAVPLMTRPSRPGSGEMIIGTGVMS